jgi:hypothetical protein
MGQPGDDLRELRESYPDWRFGSVWATAASSPDARRLWARKDEILLSAWNAAELRRAISAEQRSMR